MRFSLTSDHRDFFSKYRFIEFEEILTEEQAEKLVESAEKTIASRLKMARHSQPEHLEEEIYRAGYDLWREDAVFKSLTHKLPLAELASELFQARPIRLAFDQYIESGKYLPKALSTTATLEQRSCFKPLVGGALLLLSGID